MKRIYSIFLVWIAVLTVCAQSGKNYDPENPADPNVFYTLTLEASPRSGGSVNKTVVQAEEGSSVYCYASAKMGYAFKHWMVGDSLVSTNSSFNFKMPAENVVLTAYFDYVGYNPENPADPEMPVPVYDVSVYAAPSVGGYFNSSSFKLKEGETAKIYAYPREGYQFESWMQGGEVVSTDNPLTIKMGAQDLEYKAIFVYNPESPTDPSVNFFNVTTGEVVVDNFKPGTLYSAIRNAIGGSNYASNVKSIKVIGRLNSSDFGFAYSYANCEVVDLSRTTGYMEVPSYSFEGASALKSVYLPVSVESIGEYAFARCTSLNSLYMYSPVPPVLCEYAFQGVSSDMTVYVPSGAVELYRSAKGWDSMKIKPLDGNEYSFTINFPVDLPMAKYKDMSLELVNVQSGQTYRYVVTSRKAYTFGGLMKNTIYDVRLKNAMGEVLAELSNVMLVEDDVDVSFDSVKDIYDVTLTVQTPSGEDVTSKVNITWYDDQGAYLCQGNVARNVVAERTLQYSLKLDDNLALEYVQPASKVICTANQQGQVYKLVRMEQIGFSGRVVDAITMQGIGNATVTLSQIINRVVSKTQTVTTDEKGNFDLTAYNAPCKLSVTAYDYVSQTSAVDSLAVVSGNVVFPDIRLKSIIGATINISHTYSKSVEEGVTPEVQNWYADYENIAYEVYNVSRKKQILQFSYRYPQLVLLDDVNIGDSIRVTATSKKGTFMPVVAGVTIDSTFVADVVFNIKQLGQIKTSYKNTENPSVVGMLYGENGQLLDKRNYEGTDVNFTELRDGTYSLVTMGKNERYNSVYNMSRFIQMGLLEGVDYLKEEIVVESGVVSSSVNDTIPFFDENKFNYIEIGSSSLRSTLSSAIVGDYLTLVGSLDVIGNLDELSDLQFLVDLPSSASFVEGSVMIGDKVSSNYSFEGNSLTISLDEYNEGDKIKFCVVPTEEGEYTPNSLVAFIANGRRAILPIGGTNYSVESLTINVPSVTASKTVTVSGVVTEPNSEIEVYDNGTLVGCAYSDSRGKWSSRIELHKPYSLTYHSICAKVIDPNGHVFETLNKLLEFNVNAVCLSKVAMIYRSNTIEFDQSGLKNSSNSYSYVPGYGDFTFVTEFSDPDTTLVGDVEFIVLASDGTTRTLKAEYNADKQLWTARSKYSNSKKLPVNVAVEWVNLSSETIDNSGLMLEEAAVLVDYNNKIAKFWDGLKDVVLVESLDSSFSFKYEDLPNLLWTVKELGYEESLSLMDSLQFNYGNDGKNWFSYYLTSDDKALRIILVDFSEKMSLELFIEDESNDEVQARQRILNVANAMTGVGGAILDLVGIGDYIEANTDLLAMREHLNKNVDLLAKRRMKVDKLIDAKCEDGEDRITPTVKEFFRMDLDVVKVTEDYYVSTFEKYIEEYLIRLRWHAGLNLATLGVGAKLNALVKGAGLFSKLGDKLLDCMGYGKTFWAYNSQSVAESVVENSVGIANNLFENGAQNIFRPEFSDYTGQRNKIWNWSLKEDEKIKRMYLDLAEKIKSAYRPCPNDDDDDDDDDDNDNRDENGSGDEHNAGFLSSPVRPTIDPAGYVYEGVSSNRVEGVMASCYYKETEADEFGVIQDRAVLWNAKEYDQENPLFTDKNGMYQWFVPQGLWQVKFEKEGYETAYSEWLPVPPPQLEVNVPIVQNKQPEVKNVHAYENGVVVEFDKYMQPATLNSDNIYVLQNGEKIVGSLVMLNEEVAYKDKNDKFASKVRFVFDHVVTAGEINLTVSNRVKSYAGIPMAETFSQSFDIEAEVKDIVADSLVKVPYQGATVISVYAVPATAAAGKTMCVEMESNVLVSIAQKSVVVDKNGLAEFVVNGKLPGVTGVAFSIEGVDKKATTILDVDDLKYGTLDKPKASLASGSSVYRGSLVELDVDEDNLKIWYTLDGSCPCDENGTRKVYAEPIAIDSDMTLKAIAENAEGDASDVATFVYTILQSKSGVSLNEGWNWVSFNMENDALGSTNTALATGEWTASDVIKDDKSFDMYSGDQNKWIGTMSGGLKHGRMYKIHSSKLQTLGLTGEAVDPADVAVEVNPGWNYIGYLPLTNMGVADALANYDAEAGDVIKSQDAFATYSDENGWEGDLTNLMVGRGYMLKRNASQTTFCYPKDVRVSDSKVRAEQGKVFRYADNMNIVGEVSGMEIEDGDSLVAIVNGEVRGAVQLVSGQKVFLTVHGDETAEMQLVLLRHGNAVATANSGIDYQNNTVLGSGDMPTPIRFVANGNGVADLGCIKSIFSINGVKMNSTQLSGLPAGAYIIYSEKSGETCVTKFIQR